jgi:class 3 adenylate cyclase
VVETRKLAAILVSDVVGYSRLAGSDEDRTLARLRALRSDLIDPIIAVHSGRVVKRTGDGAIVEFRSVVDAVRCAVEVQNGMVERNAGLPPERRIEFRVGIHVGDVVEESDGDLMGDGVNIAARLEGVAKPGAICLSEDAYRQVKSRLDLAVSDLDATQLKNIAEPVRVYSLEVGKPAQAKPVTEVKPPEPKKRASLAPPRRRHCCPAHRAIRRGLVFLWRHSDFIGRVERAIRGQGRASFRRGAAFHEPLGRSEPRLFCRRHHREPHDRPFAHTQFFCYRAQHGLHL